MSTHIINTQNWVNNTIEACRAGDICPETAHDEITGYMAAIQQYNIVSEGKALEITAKAYETIAAIAECTATIQEGADET